MRFTTKAYEREAFKLVLQEANQVAHELGLRERLPITEHDVVNAFICGYGMSQIHAKPLGNIHTRDYGYFVSIDHKLSYVEGAHQDQDCQKWVQSYNWPADRIDTNGAYQLATQWLVAAAMDVRGLNQDCQLRVQVDPFWNAVKRNKRFFVPIYEVFWVSATNRADGYGDAASVKLFAPTKTLMSLTVEDPKYILRKPLQFTNLNELLSERKSRGLSR
jgi:hypothetical protein